MYKLPSLLKASTCVLALSIALTIGEAKHQIPHETTDINKIYESFSSGITIFDEDLDGDLDCLIAVRTDSDKESSTLSFLWIRKNQNGYINKNITAHWRPGPTPDEPLLSTGSADGPWKPVDILYTDNKACVVTDFSYEDFQHCLLWVSDEAKPHIPQGCLDAFKESCEIKQIVYDEGSCSAV